MVCSPTASAHRHVLWHTDCRHSSGTAVKNQPPASERPAVSLPPKKEKPTIKNILDTSLTVAFSFAVVGCDIKQTQEGELPTVDVDGGAMPAYDVDGLDVDVSTEESKISVPDVDIDMKEKTITIPSINIDLPSDDLGPACNFDSSLSKGTQVTV